MPHHGTGNTPARPDGIGAAPRARFLHITPTVAGRRPHNIIRHTSIRRPCVYPGRCMTTSIMLASARAKTVSVLDTGLSMHGFQVPLPWQTCISNPSSCHASRYSLTTSSYGRPLCFGSWSLLISVAAVSVPFRAAPAHRRHRPERTTPPGATHTPAQHPSTAPQRSTACTVRALMACLCGTCAPASPQRGPAIGWMRDTRLRAAPTHAR